MTRMISSASVAVFLAAGVLSPHASAQQAGTPAQAREIEDVVYIYGTRNSYRADESSSATRTPTAIEDIPQSIFIITRDVIDDQAMTGLGELVRYVPGVTMGQGEGHRDAPTFRGNLTTSDFFVDGMRDDLQYLRDLYNVERVDVVKGASALVFGRGNGGGALNRVSKVANGESLKALELGAGMYGQARVAVDAGAALTDTVAGRMNMVIEESDSYRDEVDIERLGIAPTLRIDASEATRIDLFAEYFSDQRTVDRGVPSQAGRPWNGPIDTYFGNPDLSNSDIEVATLRGVLTHELTPDLTFRGAASYGDYSKFYDNVFAGGAVNPAANSVLISSYNAGTDRENLLAQADLIWEKQAGGMQHTILAGVEAGRQESVNSRINTPSATFSLSDRGRNFAPDFAIPPAINNVNDLDTVAVLLQDQIAINDKVQAVLGLRWESFDLGFDDRRPGSTDYAREDDFVSPRAGLIWEPVSGLSFYGGWSKAFLPQAGEQFNTLSASLAALEPEEFENSEVGVRWQPNDNLLLSATVYQLDRANTRAPGAVAGTIELTGSQRSEGVELAIQGQVREGWNVIGAMAFQDAEITSTTSAAPAGRDAPLVPEFSASLWNRVSLAERLDVALGLIHQGDQYASISNAVVLPSYTRVDAAVFYDLGDRYQLQLNVENLTDRKYWFTAHNDNNLTPGAPVLARLRLTAQF